MRTVILMSKVYEKKYRAAYIKYLYHKRRNRVFKKLGYECNICGLEDAERLEIHRKDDKRWKGAHGRDRIDKAIDLLDDGGADELELLCKSCKALSDLGRDREEIQAVKESESDGK